MVSTLFFLLAPYIVLSIILWAFVFAGYINLPIENSLNWHIYEMIFGVGTAMIVAFFLTGLPELFPRCCSNCWKTFSFYSFWWVLGRFSFGLWTILEYFFTGFINISLTAYIGYFAANSSFS